MANCCGETEKKLRATKGNNCLAMDDENKINRQLTKWLNSRKQKRKISEKGRHLPTAISNRMKTMTQGDSRNINCAVK